MMKFALTVAGFAAMMGSVSQARADEVDVLFGPDPLALCANAAAKSEAAGAASDKDIAVCNQAVARARDKRDELAAAHVNRGALRLARGEYDAAIADSDAAIRVKRDIPEAFVNRGIALSATHRFKDAEAAFTTALNLDPARPETVYFDRALAREDMGDMKGAYRDYTVAAQLAPTWDEPKQQLARFTIAKPPIS